MTNKVAELFDQYDCIDSRTLKEAYNDIPEQSQIQEGALWNSFKNFWRGGNNDGMDDTIDDAEDREDADADFTQQLKDRIKHKELVLRSTNLYNILLALEGRSVQRSLKKKQNIYVVIATAGNSTKKVDIVYGYGGIDKKYSHTIYDGLDLREFTNKMNSLTNVKQTTSGNGASNKKSVLTGKLRLGEPAKDVFTYYDKGNGNDSVVCWIAKDSDTSEELEEAFGKARNGFDLAKSKKAKPAELKDLKSTTIFGLADKDIVFPATSQDIEEERDFIDFTKNMSPTAVLQALDKNKDLVHDEDKLGQEAQKIQDQDDDSDVASDGDDIVDTAFDSKAEPKEDVAAKDILKALESEDVSIGLKATKDDMVANFIIDADTVTFVSDGSTLLKKIGEKIAAIITAKTENMSSIDAAAFATKVLKKCGFVVEDKANVIDSTTGEVMALLGTDSGNVENAEGKTLVKVDNSEVKDAIKDLNSDTSDKKELAIIAKDTPATTDKNTSDVPGQENLKTEPVETKSAFTDSTLSTLAPKGLTEEMIKKVFESSDYGLAIGFEKIVVNADDLSEDDELSQIARSYNDVAKDFNGLTTVFIQRMDNGKVKIGLDLPKEAQAEPKIAKAVGTFLSNQYDANSFKQYIRIIQKLTRGYVAPPVKFEDPKKLFIVKIADNDFQSAMQNAIDRLKKMSSKPALTVASDQKGSLPAPDNGAKLALPKPDSSSNQLIQVI